MGRLKSCIYNTGETCKEDGWSLVGRRCVNAYHKSHVKLLRNGRIEFRQSHQNRHLLLLSTCMLQARIALRDCVCCARVAYSSHSLHATSSTVQSHLQPTCYWLNDHTSKLIRLLLAQDISFIPSSGIYEICCFVHNSPSHVLNRVRLHT